jgi:hypothetical protein
MTSDVRPGAAEEAADARSHGVLDPIERVSEILFGLIMVLTTTTALSVASADGLQVRTMLLAALGCNLAWGIIDAGMYLMTRLSERGRNILAVRTACEAPDAGAAHQAIADALPPLVARVLAPEHFEVIRQNLRQLSALPQRPHLTRRDGLGALGVCLLVFVSTFPVVIPFMVVSDLRLALRLSGAVAVAMLFGCGFALGRHTGVSPWAAGLSTVALGGVLVGVAVLLGG